MIRKFLTWSIATLALVALHAAPASAAETLTGATATADCNGATVTVNATGLTQGTQYLHISPGDWISGGYNFKFVSASHAATTGNGRGDDYRARQLSQSHDGKRGHSTGHPRAA
jgi:hypothetical protein